MKNNIKGDFNFRLLLVFGIISTLLLMEIVIVTQAYFQKTQEENVISNQIEQPSLALAELTRDQQAALDSYRWTDREKQTVSIPINEAISSYVEIERQRATTRPK